jgi:GNAT superfamily N-acetyltransferase
MSEPPNVIALETPPREYHDEIFRQLFEFNTNVVGPTRVESLAVVLKHPKDDTIIGGLWGESYYDWLCINLLIVPDKYRRRGLGSSLMRKAEELALNRRCVGIFLDTFSFQAPVFYKKLGYQAFGKIPNFPPGNDRIFYFKALPTNPIYEKQKQIAVSGNKKRLVKS